MKKLNFIVSIVLGLLLFISAYASAAQDFADMAQEGKQLVEASQYLIDQGTVMEKCACTDKAAMVDNGHMLLRKGQDIMCNAMMMYTDEGRSGNQQVAQMIMEAGGLLVKKGKKAEPLTDKDKAEVNKLGKAMVGLGNLQLNAGKIMCAE
jgi:hypothetical protein